MRKKKAKTLETKLRAALRLIWSRSGERRAILKSVLIKDPQGNWCFMCPECKREHWGAMAEVDHIQALGPLELTKLTEWVHKLFYSPQRVLCKICHRKKTTEDRRKMREAKNA